MKPRPKLTDRRILSVLWVYPALEEHVEDLKHGTYSFLKTDMFTIFSCTQCPFTHTAWMRRSSTSSIESPDGRTSRNETATGESYC